MTITDIRPNPFQPRGDRPKWAPVYDLLITKHVEDIVTYAELSAVVGYDFATGDRSPLYGAQKHFLAERGRVLRNIQHVGYRVVPVTEHEEVAKGFWRQSHGRIKRGKDTLRYTDRNEIADPEARRSIDALEQRLTTTEETSRRALRYAKNAQKVADAVSSKVDGPVDDRLRRLEQELAKLKAGE